MSTIETLVLTTESVSEIRPVAQDCGVKSEDLIHGATVTVVFPCLNEELAVGQCVRESLEVMRKAGINGSVLVVDNGSTDQSVNCAINAGARVIVQSEPGYGAALRFGFEAATTEFVIMADADGTYELDAIPKLLRPLLQGSADMVLGQRLNDATTVTMPWLHRYVGTPAITFLVRRATRKRLVISDSQSGFRAFRRQEVLALDLSSTGMEFASEMLIRSAWADLRIQEVDTKYAERIGESKLNTFSDGLRHLRQILLLSPETAASIPGILATAMAVTFWVMAAFLGHGADQVGSLVWTLEIVAGILGILGPLVFCTGIVLKYRAESMGLRSSHEEIPLKSRIRRFFSVGLMLVLVALVAFVGLLITMHIQPGVLSQADAASIASFLRSACIVGVMLMAAPLISPYLIASPRSRLPIAEMEHIGMASDL